jgi:hypothetical protein
LIRNLRRINFTQLQGSRDKWTASRDQKGHETKLSRLFLSYVPKETEEKLGISSSGSTIYKDLNSKPSEYEQQAMKEAKRTLLVAVEVPS